jgi:predicted Zn-dependent protease
MIRNLTAICLAILMSIGGLAGESIAATKKTPRGPSLPLIRDAEIEGLLRLYSKPIFRAAGLNPSSVRVYIINNDKINAFVAGGQRMFIHCRWSFGPHGH